MTALLRALGRLIGRPLATRVDARVCDWPNRTHTEDPR